METKPVSDKIIETDTSKAADTELEKSDSSNSTIQLPKQTEASESVNVIFIFHVLFCVSHFRYYVLKCYLFTDIISITARRTATHSSDRY